MHLVPFGEYVRSSGSSSSRRRSSKPCRTFSAGDTATLLPVGGHLTSVAICYEIIYPALVREFVRGGSELLTTITNDAWFGRTSAPYQHFAQASMRAIEEGRYLVRSANTGISGIVDPYGHVVTRTDIFQPAVAVGEARFLTVSTFYARHGDVFAYASVVMTIAMLALARRVPECLGAGECIGAAALLSHDREITRRHPMPTVDELMRRYEDLSKRAADLRSYL